MNSKIVDLAIEASKEGEILLHINENEELIKIPFTKCTSSDLMLSGINFITKTSVEIDIHKIVGYTWWLPEEEENKDNYKNTINNKIKFLNDFVKKVENKFLYSYLKEKIFFGDTINPIALYVFDFNKNVYLNDYSKLEYAKERWLELINLFKEEQLTILEEEKESIISTLAEEHKDYFISDFKKLKSIIIENASEKNIFSNCKTPGDVALCWPSVLEPNPSVSVSMI